MGEKLVEKARVDKNPKRVDVINRRKVRTTLTFLVISYGEVSIQTIQDCENHDSRGPIKKMYLVCPAGRL